MEKISANDELDNPLIETLKKRHRESQKKADEHEKLRESAEYQAELSFLRQTIQDLIHSIRICEIAASRWQEFSENYLLPRHFDDIVEAALTVQLAVENGALNPARRELRYMLEVAVNIAYVDEVKARGSLDERISHYRSKSVNKSNVDHVFEIPLRMLGTHKAPFAASVRDAWVRASNYVHLTKRRIDEKLRLREQGVILGFETLDMLKQVVSEVHEACSIVMALTFETIGPSFTGDILVDSLDAQDKWSFHASEYIAIIDSHFDYKHERKDKLNQITRRRNERIKYQARLQNA
jgi:hypothetical protein